MRTPSRPPVDLPDLSGSTYLVTGATSGLGREAARALVGAGAHVVMPSITRAEGEEAARDLGGSTEVHEVDLASFESIRAFCSDYTGDIDVLVDNAGLMSRTLRHTTDGLELHWGVNFVGPFLLTRLLIPQVRRRIVITASMAHAKGHVDLTDPNFEHRAFGMAAAYAQSKLACMLWATELQRRLDERGSSVGVQIAHPGFASTSILEPTPFAAVNALMRPLAARIVPTAADGARPLLYAATRDLPPVSYIGPTGPFQICGEPGPCERSASAEDPDLARRLYDYAEAVTSA